MLIAASSSGARSFLTSGHSFDCRACTFKVGEEFWTRWGLPTLKAFGRGAFAAKLAERARALSNSTFWVLALGVMTRFFTDLGTALGAAAAIAVGAWRVRHGEMSLEALLIILMAGTEIFRPLRDLRNVLHQGMIGQSAATTVLALLDAKSDAGRRAAPAGPRRALPEAVGFAYRPTRRRPCRVELRDRSR